MHRGHPLGRAGLVFQKRFVHPQKGQTGECPAFVWEFRVGLGDAPRFLSPKENKHSKRFATTRGQECPAKRKRGPSPGWLLLALCASCGGASFGRCPFPPWVAPRGRESHYLLGKLPAASSRPPVFAQGLAL